MKCEKVDRDLCYKLHCINLVQLLFFSKQAEQEPISEVLKIQYDFQVNSADTNYAYRLFRKQGLCKQVPNYPWIYSFILLYRRSYRTLKLRYSRSYFSQLEMGEGADFWDHKALEECVTTGTLVDWGQKY